LGWSHKNFWSATVWDIIAALQFHNKKYQKKDAPVLNKERIDAMHEDMRIKGRI